jgi:hypothetical protein
VSSMRPEKRRGRRAAEDAEKTITYRFSKIMLISTPKLSDDEKDFYSNADNDSGRLFTGAQ